MWHNGNYRSTHLYMKDTRSNYNNLKLNNSVEKKKEWLTKGLKVQGIFYKEIQNDYIKKFYLRNIENCKKV